MSGQDRAVLADMGAGPYETRQQARALPQVEAVYQAARSGTGPVMGRMSGELVISACIESGVVLGAYDEKIVRLLAAVEPEAAAVLAVGGEAQAAGVPVARGGA